MSLKFETVKSLNVISQSAEEDLLRLKDDLMNDLKKLKGKSRKKKMVFAIKTFGKTVFVAGTVTAALFFPPSIVVGVLCGAVALLDGGQSAVNNVRKMKQSRKERTTMESGLKEVETEIIRKQTRRELLENPTAPPLYPNLEIAKE